MRRLALALLVSLALAGSAVAWFKHGTVTQSGPRSMGHYSMWFSPHDDSMGPTMYAAFAAAPTPGVTAMYTNGQDGQYAQAHAAGLATMQGLGNYCIDNPAFLTQCLNTIASDTNKDVDGWYINEPGTTGASTVSAFNALAAQVQTTNPGAVIGITFANGEEGNCLTLLNGGVTPGPTGLAFCSQEVYNGGVTQNLFITGGMHAAYPTVQMWLLVQQTSVLCAEGDDSVTSTFDHIGFWVPDDDGRWGNSLNHDYEWYYTSIAMAQGAFNGACPPGGWTYTYITSMTGDPFSGGGYLTIYDGANGHTIDSCEYRVLISPNDIYYTGPYDPAITAGPWLSRTCNADTPTITTTQCTQYSCAIQTRNHSSDAGVNAARYGDPRSAGYSIQQNSQSWP